MEYVQILQRLRFPQTETKPSSRHDSLEPTVLHTDTGASSTDNWIETESQPADTTHPIMDVNKTSFYPLLLDILTDVSTSHFVSFDLELSGVPSKGSSFQCRPVLDAPFCPGMAALRVKSWTGTDDSMLVLEMRSRPALESTSIDTRSSRASSCIQAIS